MLDIYRNSVYGASRKRVQFLIICVRIIVLTVNGPVAEPSPRFMLNGLPSGMNSQSLQSSVKSSFSLLSEWVKVTFITVFLSSEINVRFSISEVSWSTIR